MSTPGMLLKSPTDWLGERSPHRTIRHCKNHMIPPTLHPHPWEP